MLRALAGRTHEVVTGLALARDGRVVSGRDVTHVVFAPMTEEEIRAYAASGEPDDKAGAYACRDRRVFVERVEGARRTSSAFPSGSSPGSRGRRGWFSPRSETRSLRPARFG